MLQHTGADAVMIGRAAQGRPWLFREIEHFLQTGTHLLSPQVGEIQAVLIAHLDDLYDFYGEHTGLRVARKHISWYTQGLAGFGRVPPSHESAGKRGRTNARGNGFL